MGRGRSVKGGGRAWAKTRVKAAKLQDESGKEITRKDESKGIARYEKKRAEKQRERFFLD